MKSKPLKRFSMMIVSPATLAVRGDSSSPGPVSAKRGSQAGQPDGPAGPKFLSGLPHRERSRLAAEHDLPVSMSKSFRQDPAQDSGPPAWPVLHCVHTAMESSPGQALAHVAPKPPASARDPVRLLGNDADMGNDTESGDPGKYSTYLEQLGIKYPTIRQAARFGPATTTTLG